MTLEEKTSAEVPELNGVVIIRHEGEDGTVTVDVMMNGSIKVDQVQTLIDMAQKRWRQQIGLA